MPDFRIELDTGSGGLVASATGRLTPADMRHMGHQVWSTHGFAGCYLLWDLREARFDISAQEVAKLAEFAAGLSTLRPGARMAFVTSSPLEYGLARRMTALRAREGLEQLVSPDFEEAQSWLRQAPAALEYAAQQHGAA
ncbi:MAG: hypothetical protein OXT09_13345 [Myxococcales bacterium]|nr:hypothetical protein [Myxococcales bacterium]